MRICFGGITSPPPQGRGGKSSFFLAIEPSALSIVFRPGEAETALIKLAKFPHERKKGEAMPEHSGGNK